jgi:hypothetical protein
MPLAETYLGRIERAAPSFATVVDLTRRCEGLPASHLSPGLPLSGQWKSDRIVWKEYVELYYRQIHDHEEACSLLNWLIDASAKETIWIVGEDKRYPGPRFLIIDVVDKVHHARGLIASPRDYSELYRIYKNCTRSEVELMRKRGH